jgi:hypothetical protein
MPNRVGSIEVDQEAAGTYIADLTEELDFLEEHVCNHGPGGWANE